MTLSKNNRTLGNYRRLYSLHFNQASRPERLTGPQTRLTAIVPSVYTMEPLGINNATSMISNVPAGPRLLVTVRNAAV